MNMAGHAQDVRERLLAYIHPRAPITEAQQTAFEKAATAQAEYEESHPMDAIPPGVASESNDGVSVTFASGASAGADTVRAQNARYAGLLKSYLAGETTDDGISLIYAGVDA